MAEKMVTLGHFFDIHTTIVRTGGISTNEIMDICGIGSRRQVINIINQMKYRLEAPIDYNKSKKRYIYTAPFDLIDFQDQKMLFTYYFLKSMMKSMNYIPFVSESVLERFSEALCADFLKLSDKIEYDLSIFEKFDKKTESKMDKIIESILQNRKLHIRYINQNNYETERLIEPLKLLNYNGTWYIVAYCLKDKDLRIFRPTAIENIEVTKEPFENALSQKDLAAYCDGNFGIFKGAIEDIGKCNPVRIRFYGIAKNIAEKLVWHKNQSVFHGNNERGDYVDIKLPVNDYTELMGKVLQWGHNGEIVEPEDFREKWLSEIKKMSDYYLK
ncbi:MAG: WYL domain-containing protein [Spirochaetes bacterium]|nr:WYL domain-containing protein [Spirochaetota bacterium]